MQWHYKYLETRNTCLKAAYLRKLKFSQQKVIDKKKQLYADRCWVEQLNNDDLISVCEKAEAGERKVN